MVESIELKLKMTKFDNAGLNFGQTKRTYKHSKSACAVVHATKL